MKFPVRILAPLCAAVCLLALETSLCAEPATKVPAATAVPVVAEIIYAPTDLVKLRTRLGHRVVLEGKIVAKGASRSGTTSYLNFTKNYKEAVSLVFLSWDAKGKVTKEQLAEFVGKKIHVGGLLEERSGALQMRVFDLEQIKVLP